MPSKKANGATHIKLKRNKSTIFLQIDTPAKSEEVKSALLAVLRAAPADSHPIDGESLDASSIITDEIELGVQADARKDGSPGEITVLENGDDVSSKIVLWRIRGESFNVEAYPDEEGSVDGT